MFGHRIKIEDELFDNLRKCAAAAGYFFAPLVYSNLA